MQNQLTISIIQTNTVWKDINKNLEKIKEKINSISQKTDLILLPEMFSTGFVMQPENSAETMNGSAILWMQKIAEQKQTAIAGSLIIKENNKYYNRFVFMHSSGTSTHYDKKHLFTLAGEDKIYSTGTNRLIFEYKGWKIAPFICYDLRFPVWSRNTEDYDLAIYAANWPKVRINAWDTLLKARAIENMCYIAGINRVGTDGNNLEYPGHSQIINPLGESLLKSASDSETILTITLEKNNLIETREQFQFLNDKDKFDIN